MWEILSLKHIFEPEITQKNIGGENETNKQLNQSTSVKYYFVFIYCTYILRE